MFQEHTETRHASTNPNVRSAEVDTVVKRQTGPRFFLWVDAIGGYLVCLGDEVMLGQAVPRTGVEVPILADLSRRHAKIIRDGEGYVVESYSTIHVNGKRIHDRALLRDGDEIELGSGVRLLFHKPHALSATARLDFASRHRTQPAADGILLMAESCVLGPRRQNHIVCREWMDDVILFRQGSELCCRSSGALEIDEQPYDGRGRITHNSRVTGDDFALSLEGM